MRNNLFTIFCAAIAALAIETAYAQSPAPVAATQPAAVPASAAANNAAMQATMKSLRDLKEANEQILKKQQATLEALDELQKAAEQIKVFSKRG